MSKTNQVDEFVDKLKHPLKTEMQTVIQIIREASTKIEEEVKWGGPSFTYKKPFVTINPRMTEYVALIFHEGELLKDKTGLLEPATKGKAYAKFHSMEEVKKHKANLQKVVKAWIKLVD